MSDPITYTPAPGTSPVEAPAPKKKMSVGTIIRIVIIGGVLLIGGGGWAINYFSGNITAKTPKVGECVTAAKSDADIDNVKIVGCGDATAADKVIGVLNDQKLSAFNASENPCTSFPDAESAIFYGKEKSGFILCLVPNK
jgi:hypothetical protein